MGCSIGLYHNPGSTYAGETNLRYRIDFYREEDAGWLSTDSASLNVPAGGLAHSSSLPLTSSNDIPTGAYEAAIQVVGSRRVAMQVTLLWCRSP
ncbi:MAG: hypothetical protein R2856_18810 [Caldilineaceae bacterium]